MSAFQDLSGKVAVVTGGAKGIGKAVAEALAQRGAKVAIGDLLVKEGQEFVNQLNQKGSQKTAVFIRADVTKYKDLLALFDSASKEFGGVDIAILNAGIGEGADGLLSPLDDDADMKIYNVNLGGVVKGTKVALLYLAKRGGGVIVNTASVAGFTTMPGMGAYNASKHAVVGWTRSMDHLPDICNVRVNAVCPYWVATDILNFAENTPFAPLMKKFPKASMETVVEAFLRCIQDESLVGATLVCVPDGIQEPERYELPPSCLNEAVIKEIANVTSNTREMAKKELKEAIARAKI